MAQRARRRIGEIDGHQYAPRFSTSATTLLDDFILMLLISAWESRPEERRLLTPLHGAKQRATPTKQYPAQALSLVSSDDDQIDVSSAGHFEQVAFRSSPARLNDGGYFLFRQKSCDPFFQVAFKIVLNLLRISRQWQRSFISQSACFIRGPVGVENSGF